MVKEEIVNSKIQVVITGKDGITKIVNISDLASIQAQSGDKFQVIQTVNGETTLIDNFMIVKNKETLELSFASGETLSIENFYSYNNIEMEFTVSDNSIYTLSSQSSLGQELSDGTSLVYAQGSQETLLVMSNGNESLQAALSDQITVLSSEESASLIGGAVASGLSTGTLVAGGAAVVGGAAIASGSSSSSGSSSGSSSSSSGFKPDFFIYISSPVSTSIKLACIVPFVSYAKVTSIS